MQLRALALACGVLWTAFGVQAQVLQPAAPHYDVVALRVEFQPDTTRFTTGDGTFEGFSLPLESNIDPLPHDAAYFKAHLAFLEDYVAQASQGRTRLTTHLIPEIVRVSQKMSAYSPRGMEADGDKERARLAQLVQEAWMHADAISQFDASSLEPQTTAFLIFHAGVGRDVELIGTSLDKTPLDVPSLFFDAGSLAHLGVQGVQFMGIPVTQTAILPRTETRPGEDSITETPLLLELSINGLLAASFFSYLGVPDLFNTETGGSVIGPFGLMDPLGIFAYAGLFPPLPSAWTRVALGWIEPKELIPGERFSLAAGEVARASVSDAEYFLIENRVRNEAEGGVTLRVSKDGAVITQRVLEVNDSFNRFSTDGFVGGVVTGVSNYDFALPGRDADDAQYGGGMLIWHVDERQFSGGVNNDPVLRAVDVEEADGAQDLGFDGSVGTPFDFFFSGNPASVELPNGLTIQLYENRFAYDTTPSSATNDGGESFVSIVDISAPGPIMTGRFDRSAYDGAVTLTSTQELNVNISRGGAVGMAGGIPSVYTGNRVIVAGSFTHEFGAMTRPTVTAQGLAALDSAASGYVYRTYEVSQGGVHELQEIQLPLLPPVRGPIVGAQDAPYALFTQGNQSTVVRFDGTAQTVTINEAGLGLVDVGQRTPWFVGRASAGPLGNSATWRYNLLPDVQAGLPVMGQDHTGYWGAIPLEHDLLVLRPDGTTHRIDVRAYVSDPDSPGMSISMADVDGDGVLDLLVVAGTHVLAWSQNGALLAPFPVDIGAYSAVEPLVYTSSTGPVVVVAALNGSVYALDLDRGGRQVPGFPVSTGYSVVATPLLNNSELYVVSADGDLQSYAIGDLTQVQWGEERGSARNTGFVSQDQSVSGAESLIIAAETYNWPNPVRHGRTFLRCMTSEAAQIDISIVDMAGVLIEEMAFEVSPHSPFEHLWESEVSSGLYFARVRARSASGRTATRLIRMAVIR